MIHPTAVVEAGARLGANVEVGPYAVVGADVVVGDACVIGPRVTLLGHTTIGPGSKIHTGAVLGDEPQDYHFGGQVSYTDIGANCIIREYVTVHRGAEPDTRTVVGDGCMLMAFVHLGHNCHIGNQVAIANQSTLGGHVQVEDNAFLSARLLVHQFCRIGRRAMIGGGVIVLQDVPPFCLVGREFVNGPNTVGLKRAGLSPAVRGAIRQAVKIFFFSGLNHGNALLEIRARLGEIPEVQEFIAFVEASKRGILAGAPLLHHGPGTGDGHDHDAEDAR